MSTVKTKGKKLKAAPAPAIELPPAAEVRTLARLDVDPQLLVDSPLNPRRIYDEAKIVELASSMRRVGWFGEAIARPRRDHHAGLGFVDMQPDEREERLRQLLLAGDVEMICGHRRRRGAELAGLATIRVEVRLLDDDQALELMMAENLDRADMHPLEEADGLAALLKGRTVEHVAARVGRPVSFVRQRLRLASLIAPAREAFERGELLLGHAQLIAALREQDQEEALGLALAPDWQNDRPTVGALRRSIEQNLLTDLDGAPWKLDDATLYPEAGACSSCPKRSGAQEDLFAGASRERCFDAECFDEKRKRFVTQRFATAEKKHGHGAVVAVSSTWSHGNKKAGADLPMSANRYEVVKQGACESARPAVVVDGHHDLGKAITVCADKKCKVHHGRGSIVGGGSGHDEWRARQKREQEKQKLEAEVKRRTLQKLALKLRESGAELEDFQLVLLAFWSAAWAEVRTFFAQAKGWAARGYDADAPFKKAVTEADEAGLNVLLVELALAQALKGTSRNELPLAETAKRHGVDEKAIRAEVVAEKKAHAKAKKKTPAKKKAGKGRK